MKCNYSGDAIPTSLQGNVYCNILLLSVYLVNCFNTYSSMYATYRIFFYSLHFPTILLFCRALMLSASLFSSSKRSRKSGNLGYRHLDSDSIIMINILAALIIPGFGWENSILLTILLVALAYVQQYSG